MRIGFHYHTPARTDGDGAIWMSGPDGRFIDALAVFFEEIVCFMHTPRDAEHTWVDYKLRARNVRLVSVGVHRQMITRILYARWELRQLRRATPLLDALVIRGPTPLLAAVASAAGQCPLVLLLVGDYVSGVGALGLSSLKELAVRAWALRNRSQEWELAKRSLTFVNSSELLSKAQEQEVAAIEITTSTLEESDFYVREDTCRTRPLRLLYVGRFDRSKGLQDIVRSVAQLVSEGEDIEFECVGETDGDAALVAELKVISTALAVQRRVRIVKRQRLGPELFARYRRADIFVLASHHEGFPRVIWEAMANSLPVVTTAVGGIPSRVRNQEEALLVRPGAPDEIAAAVRRLRDDGALRRRLIENGRRLALQNATAGGVGEIAVRIKDYVQGRTNPSAKGGALACRSRAGAPEGL